MMKKFLRPAMVALALVATASAASAAPNYYSGDTNYQTLDQQLGFWKQFGDNK